MDVKKHEKGLDFNQVILYIVGEMKNTTNIQGENKMKTIETKFRHMDDTNFITNKWDVCELQGTPKQPRKYPPSKMGDPVIRITDADYFHETV